MDPIEPIVVNLPKNDTKKILIAKFPKKQEENDAFEKIYLNSINYII
jgi:hypothetical protein